MASVLAFIRTHWISLASGAAMLGFLAFGILGMMSDDVEQAMQKKVSSASQISTLRSTPRNQDWIDAEKQRAAAFEAEYERALAEAHRINKRDVLMSGVFPRAANAAMPFTFNERYHEAMRRLPKDLRGGDLPAAADLQRAQQDIDELLEQEREKEEEGGGSRAAVDPDRVPAQAPPGVPDFARPPSGIRPSTATPAEGKDPKYNAEYRARLDKARSVQVYVSLDAERRSFHVVPMWNDMMSAPAPAEVWFAQMAYWIQKDLVDAIAQLNRSAAERLGSDAVPNVSSLPVKRVVSVSIDGYLTDKGLVAFPRAVGGGSGPAQPPAAMSSSSQGQAPSTLTGRKSDADFDVVQFELNLVVDQRDVLQVMDRITRQNFYQIVDCDYQRVNRIKAQAEGYYYGPDPVVNLHLRVEGYFARKIYAELMPKEIRTLLGMGDAG